MFWDIQYSNFRTFKDFLKLFSCKIFIKNKVCLPIDHLNIEDVFVKKTFYTRFYPLFLQEKAYINFVPKLVHLSPSVRLYMRVRDCSCVRFHVILSSPKPSAAAALNFVYSCTSNIMNRILGNNISWSRENCK